MLTRRLDEDDEDILPGRRTPEREMTLGTGAILGIFFGLVVSWGAFFGFGYKVGSSATHTASAIPTDSTGPATAANVPAFASAKPAAGSPLVVAGSASTQSSDAGKPAQMAPPPTAAASHSPASQSAAPPSTAPVSGPAVPVVRNTPASASSAQPASSPATATNGAFVVQVAAFSHQEDADLVVSALRTKGYAVSAHTDPNDKLIHVQVGPFSNRNDATEMKLRLNADGYNAYIK